MDVDMSWVWLAEGRRSTFTLKEIVSAVSVVSGVPVAELCAKSRAWRVSYPRQVAQALARDLTTLSFPQIGRYFGHDHTTVIYATKKIRRGAMADMVAEVRTLLAVDGAVEAAAQRAAEARAAKAAVEAVERERKRLKAKHRAALRDAGFLPSSARVSLTARELQ